MKKTLFLLFLFSYSFLYASDQSTIEALTKSYINLFNNKQYDELVKLTCFDGYPDNLKKMDLDRLKQNIEKYQIVHYEIQPLDQAFLQKVKGGFPYKGKKLVPNLKPIKNIIIWFEKSETSNVTKATMVGIKDNKYYFIRSKIVE